MCAISSRRPRPVLAVLYAAGADRCGSVCHGTAALHQDECGPLSPQEGGSPAPCQRSTEMPPQTVRPITTPMWIPTCSGTSGTSPRYPMRWRFPISRRLWRPTLPRMSRMGGEDAPDTWIQDLPPIFYYRDKDQKEIDLLLCQNGTVTPSRPRNPRLPVRLPSRIFLFWSPLRSRIASAGCRS